MDDPHPTPRAVTIAARASAEAALWRPAKAGRRMARRRLPGGRGIDMVPGSRCQARRRLSPLSSGGRQGEESPIHTPRPGATASFRVAWAASIDVSKTNGIGQDWWRACAGLWGGCRGTPWRARCRCLPTRSGHGPSTVLRAVRLPFDVAQGREALERSNRKPCPYIPFLSERSIIVVVLVVLDI